MALTAALLFLTGCTAKSQINPTDSPSSVLSQEFQKEQREEAEKTAFINEGKKQGYQAAMEEIKSLLPYFEALRASAQINNAGGLCLPPLFQDKSDKNGIKLILGKAHICEEFTVDNILKIAKDGIPGLPEGYIKATEATQASQLVKSSGFTPSSISLPNETRNFQVTRPYEGATEPKSIRVKNTRLNQDILKKITAPYSIVQEQSGNANTNYLLVEFKNATDADAFCSKYTICN